MIFFFMWVRWTVPRFRYDQVMKLGWQKLLPLAIGNLIFYAIAIASSKNAGMGRMQKTSHRRRRKAIPHGFSAQPAPRKFSFSAHGRHPVERKPLTFAERTYLPQIFGGLRTTLKHFLRRRSRWSIPSSGRRSRPATAACPRW
jgi:hypothetical protein